MMVEDPELFLRYAIPCGNVLVRRGCLDKRVLNKLENGVVLERSFRGDVSRFFPVASKLCQYIASQLGKEKIDSEVIRRYFLIEHKKAVLWRAKHFPDINVKECIVYPGRVINIIKDKIEVNTPAGRKIVKNIFIPEVNKNDWVTVHYDFACERIPNNLARKLMG